MGTDLGVDAVGANLGLGVVGGELGTHLTRFSISVPLGADGGGGGGAGTSRSSVGESPVGAFGCLRRAELASERMDSLSEGSALGVHLWLVRIVEVEVPLGLAVAFTVVLGTGRHRAAPGGTGRHRAAPGGTGRHARHTRHARHRAAPGGTQHSPIVTVNDNHIPSDVTESVCTATHSHACCNV